MWNRPLAIGEVITASRLVAPADSPDSVTLPGSPPKLATLPWMKRSAAMLSSSAKLPESSPAVPPGRSCGMFRKPRMPRR
ncbi:hypothetical protein FQZ97_1278850 [compost metagenome]